MVGALHDVWYSGTDGAGALRLVARPDSLRRTDSLDMARGLFRTAYFHAHDSTTIGCQLWGGFTGDVMASSGMRMEFIAEVVDSATGIVVGRLDSFTVAPGLDPHDTVVEPELDLVTGTYYVRMRIQPTGIVPEFNPHRPLLPVEEFAEYVDEQHPAKTRRLDASASQGRITAQPNPVAVATEIRFSVPAPSRTSVIVYDGAGHEVRRLVDGEMMETGRYAIDLDATMLPPGSYMVEFRYGARREVQKIVVVR
jgi:hypothetical protein